MWKPTKVKSSLIWEAKSLPGLKFGSAPGVAEWLRRGSAERAWPLERGGEKRLLVGENDVGVQPRKP